MRNVALLVLIALQAGCMARPVDRIPDLIATHSDRVSLKGVNLVFQNRTRGDRELAARLYEAFLRTAEDVDGAMVNSTEYTPLRLSIEAEGRRRGATWSMISMLLFAWLIPAQVTEEAYLDATLSRNGVVVANFNAVGGIRETHWLPLALGAPLAWSFWPSREEVFDDTFRDLYVWVGRDLTAYR